MAVLCSTCNRKFTNKHSLASHKNKFHRVMSKREHPYKSVSKDDKIQTKKQYECPQCSKRFDTLTDLYKHKQVKHPPIILVNKRKHNHDDDDDDDESGISSSGNSEETPENVKLPSDETDNESDISTDLIPTPDNNTDNESDVSTDLIPIPEPKKRLREDNPDSKLSYKKQRVNEQPSVVSSRKDSVTKYKKLYKECLGKSEKWKSLYVKARGENAQLQEEYETSVRLLNDTNKELKFKLNECEKVLQSLQDKVVKQQTDIDFLNEERKELRDNYEKSILHIQQLEEDGQLDAFNDISKGIFNCVSIEQIERVRKLFKKKDFAKIRQAKNVKVLQRIIQGINRGYIPLCNPQQSRMSDAHQMLLDDMDKASSEQIRKIIGTKPKILSELMYTVDDSVKLIVDLYNKFGSRHDESDDGDSDHSL